MGYLTYFYISLEANLLYNNSMPDENLHSLPVGNGDKTHLISLAEAAELYGFSQPYLAQLARRGRLKARKVGKFWVTTPLDVEEFIRSREQKGAFRSDIQAED